MKLIILLFSTVITMQTAFAQSIMFKNNIVTTKTEQLNISIQYPTVYAHVDQNTDTEVNFTRRVTLLSTVVDSINTWCYSTITNDAPHQVQNINVQDFKSLEEWISRVAADVIKDNTTAGAVAAFDYISTWSGFSNSKMMSIFIETYLYTGGANGPQCGHYATFDLESGRMVDLKSYVTDTTRLLECVAAQISKDRKYPKNATKEQTGLFCELSALPMPENIGLNQKGLVIYYNMYEIGPRAQGAITVTIPYDKLLNEGLITLPEDVLLNSKKYYQGCSEKVK